MYNSENYASDYEVSLHLREALEPLLDIYKVDVFLAGHYHSYERTCSVYNEECFELSDVRGNSLVFYSVCAICFAFAVLSATVFQGLCISQLVARGQVWILRRG